MPVSAAFPETSLVLDNNILTAWRYQKSGVLRAIAAYQSRLKVLPALTSIAVFEALYGFENSDVKRKKLNEQTVRDRVKTEQLISSCVVLPFDQASAEIAAYIIPRLPKNIPKDTLLDALTAATALAHGYGVATRDKGFETIGKNTPDHLTLRLDFWSL
jgi:predicted nucleic acid-binding protein